MQQLKWWLLRSGWFRLLIPLKIVSPKAVAFIQMCNWLKNQGFKENDFYNASTTHKDHYKLFEYITNGIVAAPFDYFEFGVDDGESLRWWLQHLTNSSARFYGFDSFEGLPEDWGKFKKGSFTHEGRMPIITDSRAQLIKGWFHETLPGFLQTHQPKHRKIIFFDADLYSSTIFVLTAMAPHLQTGDFLLFDEFFAPQHEFKALVDFLKSHPQINVKPLAAFGNYQYTGFEVACINL